MSKLPEIGALRFLFGLLVVGLLLYLTSTICDLQRKVILNRYDLLETRERLQAAERILARAADEDYVELRMQQQDVFNAQAREKLLIEAEKAINETDDLLIASLKSRAPPALKHFFTHHRNVVKLLVTLKEVDGRVVDFVKDNLLVPPSPNPHQSPAIDVSKGMIGSRLLYIFQNITQGYFVEYGFSEGFDVSNTLYLERLLNWTGVIIEGDPMKFQSVLELDRNVVSVPACLSKQDKPETVSYSMGKNDTIDELERNLPVFKKPQTVLCFPLLSILKALGVPRVDLFSLNADGRELDVLKSYYWEMAPIKVVIVKFIKNVGKKGEVVGFMKSKGFVNFNATAEELANGRWGAEDFIFVKNGTGVKLS